MFSTEIQMFLLRISSGVVGFGINWLVQSVILILFGLIAARMLRRFGSATQSVVYRTTLLAVMLWPILILGLSLGGVSRWSVELPTSFVYRQMESTRIVEADAVPLTGSEEEFPVGESLPRPAEGSSSPVLAIVPSLLAQSPPSDQRPSARETNQAQKANSAETGPVAATTGSTRTVHETCRANAY